MDITFSANSQTLFLISCTPLSSYSSFSPTKHLTIRTHFLSSTQNLRYPRKCKHLPLHIHSPRLLIRATCNSQPLIVAVAMATVSLLTVVYFSFSNRKNRTFKQESDSPTVHIFQKSTESQILGLEDIHGETIAKKRKDSIEKGIRENGHASKTKVASLQSQEVPSMHDETRPTISAESTHLEVLSSSVTSSVLLDESKDTELSKLRFERSLKGTGSGFELPSTTVKTDSRAGSSLVIVNNAYAEVIGHQKPKVELDEEEVLLLTGFNGSFRDSIREDLYMLSEKHSSEEKSVAKLNGFKAISSHVSHRHGNRKPTLVRNSILKGAELSAGVSHRTSEHVEPHLWYEEDSSRGKDKGKSRHCEKIPAHFSHPHGMNINKTHIPSDIFSSYNRFLRDGRLLDCLASLEDMERKGLLDMDKVYHARFFKICKSQKAVKEAFRFAKLIPNPTLSTFNMLLSVCASSQDSEVAFQVLRFVKEAGLKADCKLYTTLISTCAKSGKVDAMFEVFHEMVNAGVEPNVHTYGALIDGCARAGQVAKAFGAYGIMRSKKVKPDRVVFNALISACGQSGAVDRAFDVLAEMKAEVQPIEPDHVTVGSLIKACTNAGQVDRGKEVYKMINKLNIKGTPEVYSIAINSCSQTGDWEYAYGVYQDMARNGVVPDEMFLSALIDVAGHSGKLDAAFEILEDAKTKGIRLGTVTYGSLMGACSNAKNWEKGLELYEDMKSIKLKPTVPTMNALITALCHGSELEKAMKALAEMKTLGLCPNIITYSTLLVASQKMNDLEVGIKLFSQAKEDGVAPNLVMCRCLIGMCLRRFEKACSLGEPVLSFTSECPHLDNKWTSLALTVYRETIVAGVVPTLDVFSQVLGCLQLPHDASLRTKLVENLGVIAESTRCSNICSLIDGFGEYDPRAFSLLEEAASLGIVPFVSFNESPIIVDARKLQIHTAEVFLLTVLRGLKHRLAAGAKLPNITILLPQDKTEISSPNGKKTINLSGRVSQGVGALLRRVGLSYQGNESIGKIKINGISAKRWFMPKLASPFSGKLEKLSSFQFRLGKGIAHQQRDIRAGNLSLD